MARPAFSHVPVTPRFSGPQGAQHRISTLAHVSGVGGGQSPRTEASTARGVGSSPRPAQAPALTTGPALKEEQRKPPVSGGRRGRPGAAAKRRALWGLWLRPRPGRLPPEGSSSSSVTKRLQPPGRDVGYQPKQSRRQEGDRHKKASEGQAWPGSRVSVRLRQRGQRRLCAQKARPESP